MKKFKKAIPTAAILVMLSGCIAQNAIRATQLSMQEVITTVETKPALQSMIVVEEVTVPVREMKKTQPASNTMPTTQMVTEPISEQNPKKSALEDPNAPSLEMEPTVTFPPETIPQENGYPVTAPMETVPPETSPPTAENVEIIPPVLEQHQMKPLEESIVHEIKPTETVLSETEGEEQETAAIDVAVLESYARSYAQSLGFTIDYSLGQGTGGYYPALDYPISSMEQGYSVVCGCVSSLKEQLVAADGTGKFAPYRYNCKIEYLYSDEYGDWYLFWDFYG